MAVSVTPLLTLVDEADSTTGWTADGGWASLATDNAVFREATDSLRGQVSAGAGHVYHTLDAAADLTAQRVYAWILPPGSFDTLANGGLRIVLGDDTNRIAYFVAGNDTSLFTVGAWVCVVLDVSNRPSNFSVLAGVEANLSITAITEIGIGISNPSKATGNSPNAWFDVIRYGTGLRVQGGSAGDPGTFAEIAADDASTATGKAYGIVREIQPGIYGVQGDLIFGDDAGSSSFYFKDENAVVVFEDKVIGAGTNTDYQLLVQGNVNATQHFEIGVAVGTGDTQSGRNGVFFRNANLSQPITFAISGDAGLNDFEMYGGGFEGFVKSAAGQDLSFSTDVTLAPSHRLSGVSFSRCGQVDLGLVPTRNCSFTGHTGTDAAILWNESINIKNCQFLANTDATNDPTGVEHPSAVGSPYAYDNLTFDSNDFDVNNSSGSAITIDQLNGSNAGTSKGSAVTFNNAVSLTVTVKDQAGVAVQNAQTAIFRDDTGAELMNEDTDVNGVATESFNFPGTDVNVSVRVRKGSSTDSPKFTPVNSPQVITSSGLTVTITLIEDAINTS